MFGFLTIARFERYRNAANNVIEAMRNTADIQQKQMAEIRERLVVLERAAFAETRASRMQHYASEDAEDNRMIERVLSEPSKPQYIKGTIEPFEFEFAGWIYTRQDGTEFFRKPQDRILQSYYVETAVYKGKRNA